MLSIDKVRWQYGMVMINLQRTCELANSSISFVVIVVVVSRGLSVVGDLFGYLMLSLHRSVLSFVILSRMLCTCREQIKAPIAKNNNNKNTGKKRR